MQCSGATRFHFMDRYGAHVLLLIVVAYVAFAVTFSCAINPTSEFCLQSVAR